MEKICKWCSNYNKGKCSVLNEKFNTDVSSPYWGILNIIEKFFNKNFRLYLNPEDLQELTTQLTNEIDSFVDAEIENPTIELGYEQQEDFSCKYWR